ncbi:MAG TPA: HAD family phosphatase [Ilumatobacteraceae bacterium]|nr:HAD family phosphatase [Ilumatobacteraceae bacterium]
MNRPSPDHTASAAPTFAPASASADTDPDTQAASPTWPAAVLWDLDGTIVDTEPYWMQAEYDLVAQFGSEWNHHHAQAIVGFDLINAAEYIRAHAHVDLTPRAIVDWLIERVEAQLDGAIPWRPGARELLAEVHAAGIPNVLVTMSWKRLTRPIVAALDPGVFTAVIAGDDVPAGQGKPHPTPYRLGAAAAGVDPHDCLAIEDSPTGATSALAAGCTVLGVPNVKAIDPAPGLTLHPTLANLTLPTLARLAPLA